ncbi:glycine dehydrogenase (aminomethyl-transferring) [candidate division KSB1 bacterium]|nr:aminomethyl-transferring glycine dehydrogenase [candidate division KSB1 bacterium]RQW00044.1 MAG: glycine dehydrogenase (aminomethyl-transferring) [candidate division KSB1 bacterium]
MHKETRSYQDRHLGSQDAQRAQMLESIGLVSLDELIDQTVPAKIRLEKPPTLPEAISEYEYLKLARELARHNKIYKSYIGIGYYDSITPGVILRNIFENPGWYTQYTPYQSEISQGRLEALLNFQTMVIDLTGMELANASLLDEATAAAEAMVMLHRLRSRDKANAHTFFVSDTVCAPTLDVLKTRAEPLDIHLVVGDFSACDFSADVYGALLQFPAQDGRVFEYTDFIKKAHAHDCLVAVAADLLSLVLLTPPGECGADIVLGSTQRFGVPMGYGGPHAAYFATRDEYKRQVPGRIIGVSRDRHGNTGYRMALQTREQHIRREKATSNICTAQALLAIMAGMYAVYHGPAGIREIGARIHARTQHLDEQLKTLGIEQINDFYFDTLKIKVQPHIKVKIEQLADKKCINFRSIDTDHLGITLDETTTKHDIDTIVAIFAQALEKPLPESTFTGAALNAPVSLIRTSDYLQHPVFNSYHSETRMMRYIKSLEEKDLSLTKSMIPLGSCTMKLNPATAMIPVSWPEFSGLHPFAPVEQAQGYARLIRELESYLNEITGFAATSLQPNSGAQGEFTGLLVIRAFHAHHGQAHRNVVLIPTSAHGTNPASAIMAGAQVVLVDCDERGNIALDDLEAKAKKHAENLAALMVTYPSTHGVFEEAIVDVCDIIHKNGGQVYMDGANMNAQVGLTSPAKIGADVCHLNLHKTFSIPHGGGGPGVGPICVADHLAPFLPGHPIIKTGGDKAIPAVSATPWGSPNVLLISYAYIKMLGAAGMTQVSKNAILNANYIKSRLERYFPIVYSGVNGRVAHEMIIDTRQFKKEADIDVEDIAKRLIDYGFHAPTVAWPVLGTLMIEPTESEPKEELDRFCNAMIQIYHEIREIVHGEADKNDNVLKNAPHTPEEALADDWSHPYSRHKAIYPLKEVKNHKFWPPIARIDNTYGDRHLMCSCPPLDIYAEND